MKLHCNLLWTVLLFLQQSLGSARELPVDVYYTWCDHTAVLGLLISAWETHNSGTFDLLS